MHQPLDNLLLAGNGALARPLAGARIGLRPLAAHGQALAMAQPAIAADLHQALDVERDLLAEVTLDPPLLLEHTADLPDVVFRQVLHADVVADARRREDVDRALSADPVDVCKAYLDARGA